jgi:hypothetical protein
MLFYLSMPDFASIVKCTFVSRGGRHVIAARKTPCRDRLHRVRCSRKPRVATSVDGHGGRDEDGPYRGFFSITAQKGDVHPTRRLFTHHSFPLDKRGRCILYYLYRKRFLQPGVIFPTA